MSFNKCFVLSVGGGKDKSQKVVIND